MLEETRPLLANKTLKTAALVVGAAIVAPAVFSLLKPLAKAGIKTGVIFLPKN